MTIVEMRNLEKRLERILITTFEESRRFKSIEGKKQPLYIEASPSLFPLNLADMNGFMYSFQIKEFSDYVIHIYVFTKIKNDLWISNRRAFDHSLEEFLKKPHDLTILQKSIFLRMENVLNFSKVESTRNYPNGLSLVIFALSSNLFGKHTFNCLPFRFPAIPLPQDVAILRKIASIER